jgi:hypothetical protein
MGKKLGKASQRVTLELGFRGNRNSPNRYSEMGAFTI